MLKDVATGQIVKTPEGNIYRVTLSPFYDTQLKTRCVQGHALYRKDGIYLPGRSPLLPLGTLELAGDWTPQAAGDVLITAIPRGTTVLYASVRDAKPQYSAGVFQGVLLFGRSAFCKVGVYQYPNSDIAYAFVDAQTWKRVLSY